MGLLEALIVGLIALILAPGWLFYFDITPKIMVLLIGTALLLMAVVRRRDLSPGPRLLGVLLILNAASLVLSTAFSVNPALSFFGSTWRSFGAAAQCTVLLFVWLVAWRATGRPGAMRVLLRGIAVAGILCSLYAAAQYFGWDPWLSPSSYRVGEGVWSIVRPPGPLGYASYLATWLAMSAFVGLALGAQETNRFWRLLGWLAAVLSLFAMLLTGTRAAVLAVAAGVAVCLWWRGFRVPRRALFAGLLLSACAAGFYFSPFGLKMRSRTRWFVEDPWGGARPLLWRDSLRMAMRHPLLGFGPEVFLGQFPLFESKKLAQAYPDFVHESPHNMFLDALVSQGVPGLLLLGGLCAAGFAAARKLQRTQSPLAGWLAAALAAGIVSQQFTAFTMPTALLLLLTIALTAAAATEASPPRQNPFWSISAPVLALAMIYLAVRVGVADHSLEATRQFLQHTDLRSATKQFNAYWYWRLPGSNAGVWYSRAWMQVARNSTDPSTLEQSLGIASQSAMLATENAEEPFAAWYNLAEISAQRDDYRTTETSLHRAIEAHPNWFKPHWLLAQELRLESNFEEAGKEAALAAELDGGHHAEVTQTWNDLQSRRQEP